MPTPTPAASSPWRWYALLAVLRVIASVFSLSMIHPDEFFQSQEVMARHVLPDASAQKLHIPWEFQLPTPNRSVLFPSLVAGLPYMLLKALGVRLSGHILLLVPRLLLCVASFGVDWILFKCTKALGGGRDPMAVVLGFATSWPTLLFMTRPFSNTFEAIILAICMVTLLCFNPHRRFIFGLLHIQTLALGSLLAFGFFTRFTFPIFFFPQGVELVRRQDELLLQQLHKKSSSTNSTHWLPRLQRVVSIAVQGFLAFAVWSLGFITLDSWYFRGSLVEFPVQLDHLVIAPWNNLQYNMQHENLELHGVHPRATHALVNMPMLFGPLYLGFVGSIVTVRPWTWSRVWHASCVALPLVAISLAPHQEPRFLLPLLVPLHLFYGGESLVLSSVSLWRRILWIVFNVALVIFFGVLHQGGLLPLLLELGKVTSTVSTLPALSLAGCRFQEAPPLGVPLVFYKTYMPPRFALADSNGAINFHVVDLAGGSAMQEQLSVLSRSYDTALVVAPASVAIDAVTAAWRVDAERTKPSARSIGTCFPHLSTEDLALDKPLELVIYAIDGGGATKE